MSIFGRKKKDDALLLQLSRIADSLEESNQGVSDNANQALIAQLNRIADVIEQSNLAETDGDNHELVAQLSNVVSALERNFQGMPDEAKKAQLVQLDRIATALEKSLPQETKMSEQDKKKAAYALNLCLVSISQIIDYSDLYILEQEYEGILNNLNLEHMPKDEALLDILRQILDTITFFRIQEGDKQFIEKEYQDKMKTAIWSAVPNCGAILACSDPAAMLLTLVTQVGTGYMNYRRAKAEAGREKEKAEWELHKAAIEQFNGLRRELFTTAWKLADSYGFPDAWRLTESQITQYNQILKDPKLSRKLARLEDIENKFQAYPQFWYFKGNAALNLSREDSQAVFGDALDTARKSYEQYFSINNSANELLRTDPICAACALEYVSLMSEHEKELKIKYIQRAIDCAGTHFDILQMCAMAYLDIGEVEAAARILKTLVCEGYNESINAQLLSSLYIAEHIKQNGTTQYEMQYAQLRALTNEKHLIAWPQGNESADKQYQHFMNDSRTRLLEEYSKFLYGYYTDQADLFIKSFNNGTTEEMFVQFVKQIESDLNSIPYAGINEDQFARLMNKHKPEFEKFVKGKIDATSKTFDDFFKEVIWAAADNISCAKLYTMSQISNTDIQLTAAMSQYFRGKAEEHETEPKPEYTLASLCRTNPNVSPNFCKIKEKIRNLHLVSENAKHTVLLVSGEMEYYRYISDHGLNMLNVVAIINDKTINDCDLLITEKGLLVHQGQSKASKTAKAIGGWAIGGVVGGLVAYGAGEVVQWFKEEVPYANIQFRDNKLVKPSYANKHVDMDQLITLIRYCQGEFKNEIEDGIRAKIAKNAKYAERIALIGEAEKQLSDADLLARRNLCELHIHNVHSTDTANYYKVTAKISNAPVLVGDIFALIYDDQPTERYLEVIEIGAKGDAYAESGKTRELLVKCSLDKFSVLNERFLQVKSHNENVSSLKDGVSGIDVFKLSPKTNCKECGYDTCMAFSMNVVQGKETLHKCPHFSEEVKRDLSNN